MVECRVILGSGDRRLEVGASHQVFPICPGAFHRCVILSTAGGLGVDELGAGVPHHGLVPAGAQAEVHVVEGYDESVGVQSAALDVVGPLCEQACRRDGSLEAMQVVQS